MSPNLGKIILAVMLAFWNVEVWAHEDGAPFSGAFPELIKVHHAHIEDEQRLNLVLFDDFRFEEKDALAFGSSLEIAFNWSDEFRFGSEIIIPFSNTGTSDDPYGLGDIEFQVVKYAFLNMPETILTGVFSIGLPTGDESSGLGGEALSLGGKLFFDQAYRNWYFGLNLEYDANVSGPTSSEFEVASAISYSFIGETGTGMAPSKPQQSLVPTLMLELVYERPLSGAEVGENVVSLTPGVQLWHPGSGWQLRFGIEIPLSSARESDFTAHFQIGNHFEWGKLFK
ncbi:MAG: hypothetical protein IIA62_06860 [Nitrospinae bacterium]|nr:hypothetical protein [Nitrospinota bacterium]